MVSDSEYQSVDLSDLDAERSEGEASSDDPSNVLDQELGDGEDFMEKVPVKPKKEVESMGARMARLREAKKRKALAREAALARGEVLEPPPTEEEVQTPTRAQTKQAEDAEVRRKAGEAALQRRKRSELQENGGKPTEAEEANEGRAAMIERVKKEAQARRAMKEKNALPQTEKRRSRKPTTVKRGPGRPKKKVPEKELSSESEDETQPPSTHERQTGATNARLNPAQDTDSEQGDEDRPGVKEGQKGTSKANIVQRRGERQRDVQNDASDDDFASDEASGSEVDNDLEENVEAALLGVTGSAGNKLQKGTSRIARGTKVNKNDQQQQDAEVSAPVKAKSGEKRTRGRPKKAAAASDLQQTAGIEVEVNSANVIAEPKAPTSYQSPTRSARKRRLSLGESPALSPQIRNAKPQTTGKEEAVTPNSTAVENAEHSSQADKRKSAQKTVGRTGTGSRRASAARGRVAKADKSNGVKKPTENDKMDVQEEEAIIPPAQTSKVLEKKTARSRQPKHAQSSDDKAHGTKEKSSIARRKNQNLGQEEVAEEDVDMADAENVPAEENRQKGSKAGQAGSLNQHVGATSGANVDGKVGDSARRKPPQQRKEGQSAGVGERIETSATGADRAPQEKGRPTKRRKTSVITGVAVAPTTTVKSVDKHQNKTQQNQSAPNVVDLTIGSPDLEVASSDIDAVQEQGEKESAPQPMQGVTKPKPSAQAARSKSATASRARAKTAAGKGSAGKESLQPVPGDPTDVGHSWAVVGVTMLEKLQRQFMAFKQVEMETINTSLEFLNKGEIQTARYNSMNSLLSSEERKDLKRQKLFSAVDTARQSLFQKQEAVLVEFAKEVADALDEANKATQTTLGDILKVRSSLTGFPHAPAIRNEEVGPSAPNEPHESNVAPALATSKGSHDVTPNPKAKPVRRTKTTKKDNLEKEVTAGTPTTLSDDLQPLSIASLSDLKAYAANAYDSLGLKCYRSVGILKMCDRPGGMREDYLMQLLPIADKTLTLKIEELKHNGYLVEKEVANNEDTPFKVLTTSALVTDKR